MRAICFVVNLRNSRTIAVVCALYLIPIRSASGGVNKCGRSTSLQIFAVVELLLWFVLCISSRSAATLVLIVHDGDELGAVGDLVSWLVEHFLYYAVAGRENGVLHFHGFHDQ